MTTFLLNNFGQINLRLARRRIRPEMMGGENTEKTWQSLPIFFSFKMRTKLTASTAELICTEKTPNSWQSF